jgi:hypothetical protein
MVCQDRSAGHPAFSEFFRLFALEVYSEGPG